MPDGCRLGRCGNLFMLGNSLIKDRSNRIGGLSIRSNEAVQEATLSPGDGIVAGRGECAPDDG